METAKLDSYPTFNSRFPLRAMQIHSPALRGETQPSSLWHPLGLQCCAADTRDRRQSHVTHMQHTAPNRPGRRAAQHGPGHPGLQRSAPAAYPVCGLGRVTNHAVLIFLGTKPCAVNNRAHFRSEKTLRRFPLPLFTSANTGNDNQLRAPSCSHVAGAVVLSAEPGSLSHKQRSQLQLYVQASRDSSPWQEQV